MSEPIVANVWQPEVGALDDLLRTRSVPMAMQRIRALRPDTLQEWHELLVRPPGADPGRTVSLAEGRGCAADLDVIVAAYSLPQVRTVPGRVSINVSGQSVSDRPFLARFARAVEGAGVGFEKLVIEITETAPVTNYRAAGVFIEWTRAQGAWIVLDDVSDPIVSVPLDLIDGLKVDQKLVRLAAHGGEARTLLRAIVAAAKEAEIISVAEGIETPAHLSLVSALGFTHCQGFLIEHPVCLARAKTAPTPAELIC